MCFGKGYLSSQEGKHIQLIKIVQLIQEGFLGELHDTGARQDIHTRPQWMEEMEGSCSNGGIKEWKYIIRWNPVPPLHGWYIGLYVCMILYKLWLKIQYYAYHVYIYIYTYTYKVLFISIMIMIIINTTNLARKAASSNLDTVTGDIPLWEATKWRTPDPEEWKKRRVVTPVAHCWLVVEPTHLKNISQNGNLPQIGMKIKNI